MNEKFDVAIVGAGPAGISAAITLADAGVKTIVFERGEYPGAKNMSGGVVYGHNLAEVLPDYLQRKCPIERNIVESRLWLLSKDSGFSFSYRDSIFDSERKYNAFTVGRAKFDRWFAEQARQKGALIVPGTVVVGLLRDGNGRVTGVATGRGEGEVEAKVTLMAEGVNSPLAARAGLRPDLKPEEVALAVKEVIEVPAEVVEQRFGVAPGNGVTADIIGEVTGGMDGIAVMYTNLNSISLAVGGNLADFAELKLKPYELIENLKRHPMIAPVIAGGKSLEYTAHWLAEKGYDAVPKLYGDGYLIAGDSAMLFNALHREGNNLAMVSGKMAAESIIEALKSGDWTRRGLAGYARRMQESFVMKDLHKYRRFGGYRYSHKELYTEVPHWATYAAREFITVDGVPKRQKQKMVMKALRKEISILRWARLLWQGWRAIK